LTAGVERGTYGPQARSSRLYGITYGRSAGYQLSPRFADARPPQEWRPGHSQIAAWEGGVRDEQMVGIFRIDHDFRFTRGGGLVVACEVTSSSLIAGRRTSGRVLSRAKTGGCDQKSKHQHQR
jgi:hypothetical protein